MFWKLYCHLYHLSLLCISEELATACVPLMLSVIHYRVVLSCWCGCILSSVRCCRHYWWLMDPCQWGNESVKAYFIHKLIERIRFWTESCEKCITYFIDRTDCPTGFTQNICSTFCLISLACGVLFHTYIYPASSQVGSAAALEHGANVCVCVYLSVSVSVSVLKNVASAHFC